MHSSAPPFFGSTISSETFTVYGTCPALYILFTNSIILSQGSSTTSFTAPSPPSDFLHFILFSVSLISSPKIGDREEILHCYVSPSIHLHKIPKRFSPHLFNTFSFSINMLPCLSNITVLHAVLFFPDSSLIYLTISQVSLFLLNSISLYTWFNYSSIFSLHFLFIIRFKSRYF